MCFSLLLLKCFSIRKCMVLKVVAVWICKNEEIHSYAVFDMQQDGKTYIVEVFWKKISLVNFLLVFLSNMKQMCLSCSIKCRDVFPWAGHGRHSLTPVTTSSYRSRHDSTGIIHSFAGGGQITCLTYSYRNLYSTSFDTCIYVQDFSSSYFSNKIYQILPLQTKCNSLHFQPINFKLT